MLNGSFHMSENLFSCVYLWHRLHWTWFHWQDHKQDHLKQASSDYVFQDGFSNNATNFPSIFAVLCWPVHGLHSPNKDTSICLPLQSVCMYKTCCWRYCNHPHWMLPPSCSQYIFWHNRVHQVAYTSMFCIYRSSILRDKMPHPTTSRVYIFSNVTSI